MHRRERYDAVGDGKFVEGTPRRRRRASAARVVLPRQPV